MKDLRVINAKALLAIFSVTPWRPVGAFVPPSILVHGKDLYRTTEVEYNGVLVEEFVVASTDKLIVRIPTTQVGQPFASLRAYAPISLTNSNALLNFGLTMPLKSISGIDRLTQAWMIIFMTTPGTDIFDFNSGAGANSIIGKPTNRSHDSAATDLAMAITKTKEQLFQLQSRTPGIPPAEKLLSSTLSSLYFDQDTSALRATVELRNMDGDAASLALG